MQKYQIDLIPKQTVLVLGGFGFIGRHIVKQLEALGASVIVGTRRAIGRRKLASRAIAMHKVDSLDQWLEKLRGVDVVVNSVGILRPRYQESYDHVHHQSVRLLAQACERKCIRMVHISALGLQNKVHSRFLTSKREGEKAIQRTGGDWHIVRLSLIDGVGGYGTKWFQRIARWPIHFAPANAIGQICPVSVHDVAEAVAKIALNKPLYRVDERRIHEMGGQQSMDIFDYLCALAPKVPLLRIRIPSILARACSHLLDLFHLTPFSFGHYELLKFDNIPQANCLPALLDNSYRPLVQYKPVKKRHMLDRTAPSTRELKDAT